MSNVKRVHQAQADMKLILTGFLPLLLSQKSQGSEEEIDHERHIYDTGSQPAGSTDRNNRTGGDGLNYCSAFTLHGSSGNRV